MPAQAAHGIPIAMFAGAIFAALVGSLYLGATGGRELPISLSIIEVPSQEASPYRVTQTATEAEPEPTPEAPRSEPIPTGQDVPAAVAAMIDEERGEVVDPLSGVRVGPLVVHRFVEPPEPAAVVPVPSTVPVRAAAAAPSRRRPTRRARPAPPAVRPPRLHSDPGRHVVLTARQMNARGEAINGSCYRYISEVFERAGHSHWRDRRVVFRGNRNGPYADLGLIRTGDWLYIVNHPERTPVGTHSVLFVSWADRANGVANVIEHPGWGAATTGRERTYGVSRAYRIVRPTVR